MNDDTTLEVDRELISPHFMRQEPGKEVQNDTTTILFLITATNKPWVKQQYDSALYKLLGVSLVTFMVNTVIIRILCKLKKNN